MNKKITFYLLSTLSLLAAYAVAYGLDRWIEFTRQFASKYAQPFLYLWSWSLGNIVLAACAIALTAWLFPRLDRPVIWGVVVLGLLIDFLPVLIWLPLGLGSFFASILTIRSFVVTLGALTAVAGIFALIQKGRTG